MVGRSARGKSPWFPEEKTEPSLPASTAFGMCSAVLCCAVLCYAVLWVVRLAQVAS
jgi:hypothetical protein